WHGTHVGGVIASSCTLDFSADPSDPLWLSIDAYLPWQIDNVPVLGQAPLANIYPVKVFDITGGSTPTSVILDGLDHLLTLKTSGALDIDVVNMSLGGGTVYDGGDTFDTFVNTMYLEDMVVVTSAGNAGPIPNSVGSPGTSWTALSVGALDYAPSSRVLYEFLGYRAFGTGGQGLVMRPTSETRVVNFSSRGPLSDGRGGPDLAALGHWNFQAGPVNELRWAGGTSFASPTVAGAAALLNSYWEAGHVDTNAFAIRQSLTAGADPSVVGSAWKNFNSQGYGALDVPAALQVLQSGVWPTNIAVTTGKLTANVLPAPAVGAVDVYESGLITLGAGKTKDFVLEVDEYTSDVIIEVYDMTAADNSAYAYWPNAIEFNIQSGKRSVAGPVEAWLWYPQFWGDSVTYIVSDGPWVESSGAFGSYEFANQPVEPGLMKVSLAGDYSNESPVSFKVRITREQLRTPQTGFYAIGRIRMGSSALIPVDVPAGVSEMTLDLVWGRDWSTFPTSDIEMFVYDPAFNLVSLDGATFNAPERAVITNPTAGTWYVFVDGYEMYRTDRYKLFVTMD
ncbi:MAG: S8 family serine peptidase, partial [Anaerolineales bacterium]|nr:S8 family serine peptidase [Anaerolineales bacterium]